MAGYRSPGPHARGSGSRLPPAMGPPGGHSTTIARRVVAQGARRAACGALPDYRAYRNVAQIAQFRRALSPLACPAPPRAPRYPRRWYGTAPPTTCACRTVAHAANPRGIPQYSTPRMHYRRASWPRAPPFDGRANSCCRRVFVVRLLPSAIACPCCGFCHAKAYRLFQPIDATVVLAIALGKRAVCRGLPCLRRDCLTLPAGRYLLAVRPMRRGRWRRYRPRPRHGA